VIARAAFASFDRWRFGAKRVTRPIRATHGLLVHCACQALSEVLFESAFMC
jgi:hypothetical protein